VFEMSEVRLGLPIGWILGRQFNLSHHAAMEIALCGQMTAQRAQQIGLVNEVVADDRLLDSAMLWARKIVKMPRATVRANRELVDKLISTVPTSVTSLAADYMHSIMQSPESREAIMSFYEHRPPRLSEK
jgi:enoyl-CoA hydratase/carnithine racemase